MFFLTGITNALFSIKMVLLCTSYGSITGKKPCPQHWLQGLVHPGFSGFFSVSSCADFDYDVLLVLKRKLLLTVMCIMTPLSL